MAFTEYLLGNKAIPCVFKQNGIFNNNNQANLMLSNKKHKHCDFI